MIWEKRDYDEENIGLWIIPLEYSKYYDFRLDMARIVFREEVCM